MRKLQNKKQGVPWDCFLSYRLRIIYRQAMRPHLIKLNLIWYFVLSLFTSSTIQTNHVHHLHSTLSTDEELTLTSYKVKTWSRLSSCRTGQREWSAPHKGLSAYGRLRKYAFNKSTTESHWISITQVFITRPVSNFTINHWAKLEALYTITTK